VRLSLTGKILYCPGNLTMYVEGHLSQNVFLSLLIQPSFSSLPRE
jgi:hypothetical protein